MPQIDLVNGLGLLASATTLLAFAQRSMLPMRLAALAANGFFIGYGALGGFLPVLGLHLILLPLNLARLGNEIGRRHRAGERRTQALALSVTPESSGLLAGLVS